MSQPQALVIDDEPDICELLTLTLRRMNIHAEAVVDIASAKKLLNSRRFDICLTDMRLPDGDGLELVDDDRVNVTGAECRQRVAPAGRLHDGRSFDSMGRRR